MLKITSQNISLSSQITKTLSRSILYSFSQQPGNNKPTDYLNKKGDQKKQVRIDEKYKLKSAALYDKYLLSREKPTLSLDEYQINYSWVITRLPIFLPYHEQAFNFYKHRYQMSKKTGYYTPLPKELIIEQGDYLFEEYEKSNPENIPSHETVVNNQTVLYRENARYWKYTDPNITSDKSVQAYSSENVFLIVQSNNGEWIFPERPIAQKQTHEDFFKSFATQLFAGEAFPNLYFDNPKPTFVAKQDIPNMDKGKGIKTFYFTGISMSGIPKFPTGLFKDYKWVPKPHLHKFFSQEYARKTVPLADFWF